MSKVVAPLQSFSASGKIGKSIVFFSHLGRNVVRGLVTPANPQDEAQGAARLLLAAFGRSTKPVSRESAWFNDVAETVPSGQTWVSAYVTAAMQIFGTGSTGVAALNTAFDGHSESDQFQEEAEGLGLTPVTIGYAGSPDTISAGAQLYALARHTDALAAANPTLFDRAPYTTPVADWSSSNVAAFASDIQPAE